MNGKVIEFDAHSGLGVIESVDGARNAFHCTQLADGNRDIKVGTAVRYEIVPGGLGVWEAGTIEPATSVNASSFHSGFGRVRSFR